MPHSGVNNSDFTIVGIGASAGGIEATTALLDHLPPDTGYAYVLIIHLDPQHESKLSEIFAKHTQMKVIQAVDHTEPSPNTLYIIPPAQDIKLENGRLVLNLRQSKPAPHLPVDQFFISMAQQKGVNAIGIILSGTANDGTAGLKAIKEAGGITFAQDESAKFSGMPKSALAEDAVDFVLPSEQIASELAKMSRGSDSMIASYKESLLEYPDSNEEYFNDILQQLRKSAGVDFSHYKMNTIRRRILRRMLLQKFESLKEYAVYLNGNAPELNVLYHDLLIKVTYFFRDADTLEYVKKTVLPQILKSKSVNQPLRIWVPACSTGEEAYSLAMIIIEVLGEKANNVAIQIFATDLSEVAIARARMGIYSLNDVMDISPKRLQRFFTKIDGSYRIIKSIRDLCVFAPHNIFLDPPFSRLDIISCCNLMIYLDNVLQNKILSTFHYALNPEGFIVLGKSESIGNATHLFNQLEKKYKVFSRKREGTSKAFFDMNYRLPENQQVHNINFTQHKPGDQGNVQDIEKLLEKVILTSYSPPCVLVNQELDILISKGATAPFLELPKGRASLNLLKMAKPGLAFELRSAIHKAAKSGTQIKKNGIAIIGNEAALMADIQVIPVTTANDEKLFLIVFSVAEKVPVIGRSKSITKDALVKQLSEELAVAREDMRLIIDEQEASMAELQSANEEIVSSNEELQSINEELETSKEEVESSNEELMTINSELQLRNEQLAESYEYAEVVLRTMREAVMVLNRDFKIHLVNKAFYKIFPMTPDETEGRSIYTLQNNYWDIPALRELLEVLLVKEKTVIGYEITNVFPGVGEKFLVVNAITITQKSNNHDQIMLAIEDITEHRKGQKIIAEREAWFRNMADNAPALIWVSDEKHQMTFFNKTWLEFTGKNIIDEKNGGWQRNLFAGDLPSFRQVFDEKYRQRQPFEINFRILRKDGEYRWMKCFGKPTFSTAGQFSGFIGACHEIHDEITINEKLEEIVVSRTNELRQMNRDLEYSNDELKQFAYVASHDLQEPLRKITTYTNRLLSLQEQIPVEARKFITKINDSSIRMTRLIDDVLNFSAITHTEQKFVRIDLRAILREVLYSFDLLISQKKARLTYPDLPIIEAVPSQMKQLFHNLISNALKFARADSPEITITCSVATESDLSFLPQQLKSGNYFHLVFHDNGIGFDQEFAEKIFVIFQRLNDKKSYPGTGIGLALCKKIVDYHGGHIYAHSKEGEWTDFHVILPEKQNLSA